MNESRGFFIFQHLVLSLFIVVVLCLLRILEYLICSCLTEMDRCIINTCDGNVLACCLEKDAKYVIGNMAEIPLKEIFKSMSFS
jgi:hypothetical protein